MFQQTVSFCICAPTKFGGRGRLSIDFSADLSYVIFILRVGFNREILPRALTATQNCFH